MAHTDEASVRFNILGSLECVTADGELIPLGGPVPERVLVCLLLSPGRVITVDRLVTAAWGDDPPATAAHQVRKAVAGLRGRIPGGRKLIVTDGPGYRIVLGPGQLDLTIFTDLVRRAQDEADAGRPAPAVEALRDALALWRGPVLAGAGGTEIEAASAALEERRMVAAERFYELRLRLGESAELVGDLRYLVNDHPFRETLRGQLMLALYRSGRPAEALVEYDRLRTLLAGELGVDPGERLTELHQAILRNSPDLAAAGPPVRAVPGPRHDAPGRHPCTLPYDLPDFTGRQQELARLVDGAGRRTGERGPGPAHGPGWSPRIVAIDGMGGSGKTSLAIRMAHLLADSYPDAHLHLDLRGHTPGEEPLPPGAVAGTLLRMLDVPGERIPEDTAGRLAMWRSQVAGYRLLLVLDNVADSRQVLPLLPGSADTLVIVTSRTRLVELDGAEWVSLGMLPEEDGAAMMAAMLGRERAEREPDAIAELIDLCGHLPLALRIAGARLRNRPRWTVRHLVDRLRDETRRLDELKAGDRSVTANLTLSYDGLAAPYRTAFMLLGRNPGADLDRYSAAALLGTGPARAEEILEFLLDTHLLQQHEAGRYAFHDLVRSFAQWIRARDGDRDGAGDAAVERLFGYYRAASELACAEAFPGWWTRAAESRPAVALPPLTGRAVARAWLHREVDNLVQAANLAQHSGAHRHAAELAHTAANVLDARGRFDDFHRTASLGVTSARSVGDESLLSQNLSDVAAADWRLGRLGDGLAATEESLELAVAVDDRIGEARSTGMLGLLLATLGRYPEALPALRRSVALKRELGQRRAQAESLIDLSGLYEQWGRYPEAAAAARDAVELSHGIRAWDVLALALTDLAAIHLAQEEPDEAHRCLDRALETDAAALPAAEMARMHALLARAHHGLGRPAEALRHARRALEEDEGARAPVRQASVRNTVGDVYRHHGRPGTALGLHTDAHRIASEIGYRIEVARALAGLSEAARADGDAEAAAHYGRRAQAEFDRLGVPEPARPRSALAGD
ncbi:AfsR/SARP family transcriptional regulator [Catenuloplanes atrovinosus]|uniref:AfsR/SARP family transcriptional regulator n=1 Tax=Catenuloplanes atrovinosus TaxID=137266 RepID=UPI00286AA9C7|nr:BTAD domain-containing putative transcriptional regulator [Catenuloplanes atrovinosus]